MQFSIACRRAPVQKWTLVPYLKVEVVSAGALASQEGPLGGEAAAAWAPGPAEHPSAAAALPAECRWENLEKHLG